MHQYAIQRKRFCSNKMIMLRAKYRYLQNNRRGIVGNVPGIVEANVAQQNGGVGRKGIRRKMEREEVKGADVCTCTAVPGNEGGTV